jgi:tRNA threonylcarbamoyladenosine biosynthesis protein TsaE
MVMNDTRSRSGYIPDEAATLALGAALAAAIEPGLVIYLQGDLGAGKTTLTRGFLAALGHSGRVKSPTYTLVESYPLPRLTAHHFDLYRFADPDEWEDAGFRDYFDADSVCLVEWPDKAAGLLPTADLVVELDVAGDGRTFVLSANSEHGTTCLSRITIPCAAA